MDIWKIILNINSGLWIVSAVYCVYATTYGIISLDWHRFVYGIAVVGILTISEVVIAFIGDQVSH
ncbi:MAG: hypothetical protein Q8R25_04115 [bacterium]|nr:hypothetical protein [bacterium]